MRILLANRYYTPNMKGGSEHSVKLLAENLKKRGYKVAIYCIDNESKQMKREMYNGIIVFRGYCKKEYYSSDLKISFEHFMPLFDIGVWKDFYKVIKEFKPDVVNTNNFYFRLPILWLITRFKGINLVHTVRDCWYLYANVKDDVDDFNFREKRAYCFFVKYIRFFSRLVNCVTCPSKFLLKKCEQKGYFKYAKKKCIVNAVDLNIEDTNKQISKNRENTDAHIQFIYVGSLEKIKGIDIVLNAFKSNINPHITLAICGDGKLRNMVLRAEKEDLRIKYYGNLNKTDLDEKYRQSDVAIVSSVIEESFGRVVIEAAQNGIPVIGSNLGGIKEIITYTHIGEIYEYNSEQALSEKMEYFSIRKNLKKYYKNIEETISIYDSQRQVNKFLKVYRTRC